MVSALIKQYWNVALLKHSPENTPYSVGLLWAFALLFYLVVISQWSMVQINQPTELPTVVFSALMLCFSYALYNYILLLVFKLKPRFVQTLTCMFATHTIIHIMSYPLLAATPYLATGASKGPIAFMFMSVYLLMTILLTAWQLMVTVFIYKQSLNLDNLAAILATIGMFATNIIVVSVVR
jgi:hypothetical protein